MSDGGIPPDQKTLDGQDTVLPPVASCVNLIMKVPKLPPLRVMVVDDERVISAILPLLKLMFVVVAVAENICSPPPAVAQLFPS